MNEPIIHEVFEAQTSTWQYVVADSATKDAVIIDPVLDFDPVKNIISTQSADAVLSLILEKGYKIDKLLETHVHADHLTGSKYLQSQLQRRQGLPPDICIGKRIHQMQERFGKRYGIPKEKYDDAFDHVGVGMVQASGARIPGVRVLRNIFCGDSLFNVDVGSARCDFPGGDANALYRSVRKLLCLPDHYKIWTGHDYPPGGDARNDPQPYYTVADQRKANKHLNDEVKEEDFVKWRKERDATLAEPRLIHAALQMNIRAGQLPCITPAGDRMLHLPVKVQGEIW